VVSTPQFGKVMPQIVTEPERAFSLPKIATWGSARENAGTASRCGPSKQVYDLGTAFAFLLLERLL